MAQDFFGHGLLADGAVSLSPEQRAEVLAWYARYHGEGGLDLARFVPFWLDRRPEVFVRYRRWGATVGALPGGLPPGGVFLLHVPSYAAIGNVEGALYELIGARELGATAAEGAQALGLSGADLSAEPWAPLFAAWPGAGTSGLGWPPEWHRTEEGALPQPMPPLCAVHLALLRNDGPAAEVAAGEALARGASARQLLHVVALAAVYAGDVGMDAAAGLDALL